MAVMGECHNGLRDACRAVNAFDRNVFCIVARGVARAELPAPQPCLKVYRWSGVIGLSDMEFYCSGLIPPDTGRKLNRRVRIAVIARIAMWDTEVADRLARETFERALRPGPVLLEVAGEREWSAGPSPSDLWKEGAADVFDDEATVQHSAFLQAAGLEALIEQRIWSAQVGVLFPYVETRRRELLARLRRRLVIPFEAGESADRPRVRGLGTQSHHSTGPALAGMPAIRLGCLGRSIDWSRCGTVSHISNRCRRRSCTIPRSIDVTATDALLPPSGPDRIEGDGSACRTMGRASDIAGMRARCRGNPSSGHQDCFRLRG